MDRNSLCAERPADTLGCREQRLNGGRFHGCVGRRAAFFEWRPSHSDPFPGLQRPEGRGTCEPRARTGRLVRDPLWVSPLVSRLHFPQGCACSRGASPLAIVIASLPALPGLSKPLLASEAGAASGLGAAAGPPLLEGWSARSASTLVPGSWLGHHSQHGASRQNCCSRVGQIST